MKAVAASLGRVWLLAGQTLREAGANRLFVVLFPLGLLVLGLSLIFRQFHFGTAELRFLADFGFATIQLFGAVFAIGLTAQSFFAELEHRTVLMVLARPVARWEFLAGKALGVALFLAVITGVLAMVVTGLLVWRAVELRGWESLEAFPFQGLLLYTGLQWLKLVTVAMLTLLACALARSLMLAVGVGVLLYLLGHVQFTAREVALQLDSPALQAAFQGVALLLPNLQLFHPAAPFALLEAVSPEALGAALAYGALYPLGVLAVAALAFHRREL